MKKVEKKNIIFLDIDGVIQPYQSKKRFEHDMNQTIKFLCEKSKNAIYESMDKFDVCACFYDWDRNAIEILKKILNDTNSFIVFSTGWREYNTFEQLKALFAVYELEDRCIGSCEKGFDKAKCIQLYIDAHKEEIKNYIIIDDQDFTFKFGQHFLFTNNLLKEENYLEAVFLMDEFDFEEINKGFKLIHNKNNQLEFLGKEEKFEDIKIFKGYFKEKDLNLDLFSYCVLMKYVQKQFFEKYNGITIITSKKIDGVFKNSNIGVILKEDTENNLYYRYINTNHRCNHFKLFNKYGMKMFN